MPTLIVTLDAAGLRALRGREHRIAVAKSGAATVPSVVWTAVPPGVQTTITWNETYGVFAGSVHGSPIEIAASLHPARDRSRYAFREGAFNDATADDRIRKNHYEVRNETPGVAGFGLLQAVTVSGRHSLCPVNLSIVPAGIAVDFGPVRNILVWSDATAMPGTVVSHAPVRALVISYASGKAMRRCRYDVDADAFFLDSG